MAPLVPVAGAFVAGLLAAPLVASPALAAAVGGVGLLLGGLARRGRFGAAAE